MSQKFDRQWRGQPGGLQDLLKELEGIWVEEMHRSVLSHSADKPSSVSCFEFPPLRQAYTTNTWDICWRVLCFPLFVGLCWHTWINHAENQLDCCKKFLIKSFPGKFFCIMVFCFFFFNLKLGSISSMFIKIALGKPHMDRVYFSIWVEVIIICHHEQFEFLFSAN